MEGPVVAVMAMLLDSDVADWFEPWTRWLKLMPDTCACLPKILRGECRRTVAWLYPLGG